MLFSNAAQLLGDKAALDSDSALRSRLSVYTRPDLLVIDEVGYLSYSNRHADLLFELISRRYESKNRFCASSRCMGGLLSAIASGIALYCLPKVASHPGVTGRQNFELPLRAVIAPQMGVVCLHSIWPVMQD